MWSITPEAVERIKGELKGREAALRAMLESETEKLDAELLDLEALETVANAFAAKHLHESRPADLSDGSVIESAPVEPAAAEFETVPEPEMKRGMSRWRAR